MKYSTMSLSVNTYRYICSFILCHCNGKIVKKTFFLDKEFDVFQDGEKQ